MAYFKLLGLFFWINSFVIPKEEKYLIETFGDEYDRYLTAVKKWMFFRLLKSKITEIYPKMKKLLILLLLVSFNVSGAGTESTIVTLTTSDQINSLYELAKTHL